MIKGKRAIISHALQTSGNLMERWRCETECKLTPEHPTCRPSSSRRWPCSLPPPLARQAESNLAKAPRVHLLFLSPAFLISFFLRTPWQHHTPLASFPSHPFPLLSFPLNHLGLFLICFRFTLLQTQKDIFAKSNNTLDFWTVCQISKCSFWLIPHRPAKLH